MRAGLGLAAFLLAATLLVWGADSQCSTQPSYAITNTPAPAWRCTLPVALNGTCTVTCNTNYQQEPLPWVRCIGVNTWSAPSATSCNQSCIYGPPPASLIGAGGYWPAVCKSGIRTTAYCQGVCNTTSGYFGRPLIQCLGLNFATSTFFGACRQGPVCNGIPAPKNAAGSALSNGIWPSSCSDTSVNSSCSAVCNAGTGGPNQPVVKCLADPTNPTYGGKWSTTFTGECAAVCSGAPKVALANGTWPDSCTDRTVVGQYCFGTCDALNSFTGAPKVQCVSGGWSTTVLGGCKQGTVCHNMPPTQPVDTYPWPTSCMDTPVGKLCTTTCQNGKTSSEAITIKCVATTVNGTEVGVWNTSSITGFCTNVCPGMPDPGLINGTWNPLCNSAIPENSWCGGQCANGLFGTPWIRCSGGIFPASTMVGGCSFTPVCATMPPTTLANAQWPTSCRDTPVGKNCTATCTSPLVPSATGPPVDVCVMDPSSSSQYGMWDATISGGCVEGCVSAPPQSLLANESATWPASCAGSVANQWCRATCAGSTAFVPMVQCVGSSWIPSTYFGTCSNTTACPGLPPIQPVDATWPLSCRGTPAGQNCTSTCAANKIGVPYPPTMLCINDTSAVTSPVGMWDTTTGVQGTCESACMTPPDPRLLAGSNGSWPASCAGTATSGWCYASCNTPYGGPKIQCSGSTWNINTFVGRCSSVPVCQDAPPQVSDGDWPQNCTQLPVGENCTAVCNCNEWYCYVREGIPVIPCLDAGNGTGYWGTASPLACYQTVPGPPNAMSCQSGIVAGTYASRRRRELLSWGASHARASTPALGLARGVVGGGRKLQAAVALTPMFFAVGSMCPSPYTWPYPDLPDLGYGQLVSDNFLCLDHPTSPVVGVSAARITGSSIDSAGWAAFTVPQVDQNPELSTAVIGGLQLLVVGNTGNTHYPGKVCYLQSVNVAIHGADESGEPSATPIYEVVVSPALADTWKWLGNETTVLNFDIVDYSGATDATAVQLPFGTYWLKVQLVAPLGGYGGSYPGRCYAFWGMSTTTRNPPLQSRWQESGDLGTNCTGIASGSPPPATQTAYACVNAGNPGGSDTGYCTKRIAPNCVTPLSCPQSPMDFGFAFYGYQALGQPGVGGGG